MLDHNPAGCSLRSVQAAVLLVLFLKPWNILEYGYTVKFFNICKVYFIVADFW